MMKVVYGWESAIVPIYKEKGHFLDCGIYS